MAKPQNKKTEFQEVQTPKKVTATQQVEDMLHLLVDSVEDYAIFLMDETGHIASWNIGAERIKGYRAADIIGQPYSIFFTNEDKDKGKPDAMLMAARQSGHVQEEGVRVRKNGSKFWADTVLTALYDKAGILRGYGKVTRDITARKSTEKLKRAYGEVEQMVRDINALNKELKESNSRLVGREYRVRELENEVRLLKMRLDLELDLNSIGKLDHQ